MFTITGFAAVINLQALGALSPQALALATAGSRIISLSKPMTLHDETGAPGRTLLRCVSATGGKTALRPL